MKPFMMVMLNLCLVFMLAACGSASNNSNKSGLQTNTTSPSPNPAKAEPSLEELAKKEGKLVFYTSSTKTEMDPILNLFAKKYGIEVEYMLLRGNEMVERIKTESRTGKFTADIADSGPTTLSH